MFTGFVAAALYFFSPVKDTSSLESAKTYTIGEITSNTSIEMDSYSVRIKSPIPDTIAVKVASIAPNKKARAEDYYGTAMPTKRDADIVHFKPNGNDFAVIKFSEDFEDTSSDTAALNENKYQIASSAADRIISEKRILQLNKSYYEDYDALGKQIGIPSNVDFSFSIEFKNGDMINAEMKSAARAEIFSETKSVGVLRKNGATEFARLTVRVW
jgi:hypothetical protein